MTAKRPPAVCIIRHNYYPDSHVRRDAEALDRAGHDVHVIALRRPGQAAREVVQGVTVHRLPVEHHRGTVLRYAWEYLSFAFLACLTVARLHLRRRFRVVEVDSMPDVLVFSAIIPKLLGAKVILYIFDNMPELLQVIWKVKPSHPLVRILAWMERRSAGFADRVIVSQETARQVVIARGVPEAKVSVVLNSADEAIFHQRPRLVESQASGAFEIVTHGAILERYGVQTLIEAVPLLAKQGLDVRVQVFGEGEYGKSLRELARRKGVADRVIFQGFVPQDELLATLSRADLGYVGMLCDLMLSNKLVEYVSLGIPTVVPRWPTFEHYFSDDTVTYYDAGDAKSLAAAIVSIAENPEEARIRAARATAIYQGYRWSVQQQAYVGIFEELMTGPRMAQSSQPAD